MRNRAWLPTRRAAAVLCAAATGSALAVGQPPADPWGGRDKLVATYEQMSRPALRRFFLNCDREASRRIFDFNEGVHCALAWDVLLRRDFGGSVDLALKWWRAERDRVDRRSDGSEPDAGQAAKW